MICLFRMLAASIPNFLRDGSKMEARILTAVRSEFKVLNEAAKGKE